jgi:hypothetical protein
MYFTIPRSAEPRYACQYMPTVATGLDFAATRLGVIMSPEPGQPHEAWGVLNPGGARSADGAMQLFPRLIAEGNYSRIGHARVYFDGETPVGTSNASESPSNRTNRTKSTRAAAASKTRASCTFRCSNATS